MRIVAVSDTHTFERDLGTLPDGDVFIHAGDLLRFGTLEELRPVATWIHELPFRHKIVVAGNHDWCFIRDREAALRELGSEITYLEDSGTTIDGVSFWGSPWQPEFGNWAFNLPRGSALTDRWDLIPTETDILITHGPPLGFGDRPLVPSREGCEDLLRAVRRVNPSLHLFGHIHQDGGFWRDGKTCFANVTTWESDRRSTVIDYVPESQQIKVVDIPENGLAP